MIAGFALDESKWDGPYVARRNGRDPVYDGKVDYGFEHGSSAKLRQRLTPQVRKMQVFSKRIAQKGIWVEPKLLVSEYRAQSAEEMVRHPSFKGLREDV